MNIDRKIFMEQLPAPEKHKQMILALEEKLLPQQMSALPWMRWCFYGGRAKGVTYTIFTAAVIEAINYPNMEIRCYDHFPEFKYNKKYYLSELDNVINKAELPIELFSIKYSNGNIYIKFMPKEV